jgi:hypothetical protein
LILSPVRGGQANLPMFSPPHRMGAFSEMATGLRS